MSKDELVGRLYRIYAALDEALEGDLAKFAPTVTVDEKYITYYQDFLGGLNQSEITNLAYGFVHNIANFKDHLKRWARNNGHDSKLVDSVVTGSPALQIAMDLSNNDKHGYPPRNGGHSGKSPQLIEINRVMRIACGGKPGSSFEIYLTAGGWKQVGEGSATVIVSGSVIDSNRASLGDLYDLCVEAVAAWEDQLKAFGVIT